MRSVLAIITLTLSLTLLPSAVFAQAPASLSRPVARLSGGSVYLVRLPSGLWEFQWIRPRTERPTDCRSFMLAPIIEQNRRSLAQALQAEVRRGHDCEVHIESRSSR